ncbi:MAG: BON domain-containing protein [Pseudomonadales bacterium]
MSRIYARSFLVIALATGFSAITGCASTPRSDSTVSYLNDSAISADVKYAIFKDPGLNSVEINVETFKGIVQLSGYARSEEQINRTVEVARSIHGVQSVYNNINLKQMN